MVKKMPFTCVSFILCPFFPLPASHPTKHNVTCIRIITNLSLSLLFVRILPSQIHVKTKQKNQMLEIRKINVHVLTTK